VNPDESQVDCEIKSRSKNLPLTLLIVGEPFWFNAKSTIKSTHLIEREPVLIGFWRVGADAEGQRITGRSRHLDSIVTTKCGENDQIWVGIPSMLTMPCSSLADM
jgi:hypothetical protein